MSVHKLYDGAIYIILGGMNLFAYILFICWYFYSEIHESSVYHSGFDTGPAAAAGEKRIFSRSKSFRHLHTSHVAHLNSTVDFFSVYIRNIGRKRR